MILVKGLTQLTISNIIFDLKGTTYESVYSFFSYSLIRAQTKVRKK